MNCIVINTLIQKINDLVMFTNISYLKQTVYFYDVLSVLSSVLIGQDKDVSLSALISY